MSLSLGSFAPLRYVLLACGLIASQAIAQSAPSLASPEQSGSAPTMGDLARQYREKKREQVKVSGQDAKDILNSVDTLLAFASTDSGLTRHAKVARQLIGQADVEQRLQERLSNDKSTQRLERAQLTMKKFGMVPRDFEFRKMIVGMMSENIAAYYDDKNKTIYLLNWVPLRQQRPVLAHELTHALQDQNFDLQKWLRRSEAESQAVQDSAGPEMDNGEHASARTAVIEGQAMVVLVDYNLAEFGRRLQDSPGLIEPMQERLSSMGETPSLHQAPLVLRNGLVFPYREGFTFAVELLVRGGTQQAFVRPFSRPPQSTHEILHPEAYLAGEKIRNPRIPKLQDIVGAGYEPLDSGTFGEFDVRNFLQQFAGKKVAFDVSPGWQGGSYVMFRRKPASDPRAEQTRSAATSMADLAFVYVSRWKTEQLAQRFANLYTAALQQRYTKVQPQQVAPCSGKCPLWSAHFTTEEGPVVMERWPDNQLVISEGFDVATSAEARDRVLKEPAVSGVAQVEQPDLSLRYASSPVFGMLQQAAGQEALRGVLEVR